MTIEEEYRCLVNMTIDSQEHFILLMKGRDNPSYQIKRRTWLHLLGLIETWDIIE